MPRSLRRLMHMMLFCPLSKGLQARLPAVKVKYLLVLWFGILVASWMIYMQYSSYSELCRGHVCTMIICDHYHRGIISGSACKSLCEEKTLSLQHCLSTSPTHQVYSAEWKENAVLVKCGIEESMRGENGPESPLRHDISLYDKPTRGTSMDEFRAMLHSFLKVSVVLFHIITPHQKYCVLHNRTHACINSPFTPSYTEPLGKRLLSAGSIATKESRICYSRTAERILKTFWLST